MKISDGKELTFLANKFGMFPEFLNDAIVMALREEGRPLEFDPEDFFGQRIGEIFDNTAGSMPESVTELRNMFFNLFKRWPNEADSKNFASLVVLGDHDCPECGGLMETIDLEKEVLNGSKTDQEPEYKILSEVKRCTVCNCEHTFSNED